MATIRDIRGGADDPNKRRSSQANPRTSQEKRSEQGSQERFSGESDGLASTGDYKPVTQPDDIPTRVRKPTASEKLAGVKKEKGKLEVPTNLHQQLMDKAVEWYEWLPPTANRYGTYNADKAVRSAIELGNKYQPVMAALIRIANAGNTYYLGQYFVGMIYAIRMDLEGLDPDTKLSKWLGVQSAWDATHDRRTDLPRKNPNLVSENERKQYEPPFKFIPVNPAWAQPGYNPYDPMGRYTGQN